MIQRDPLVLNLASLSEIFAICHVNFGIRDCIWQVLTKKLTIPQLIGISFSVRRPNASCIVHSYWIYLAKSSYEPHQHPNWRVFYFSSQYLVKQSTRVKFVFLLWFLAVLI
jgi:hypothetical protein